jgi:hypothetical protein
MAASHIRTIGAFVMWCFRGFKGSFKSQMNNFALAFLVGTITILIVFIGGIYLDSINN